MGLIISLFFKSKRVEPQPLRLSDDEWRELIQQFNQKKYDKDIISKPISIPCRTNIR